MQFAVFSLIQMLGNSTKVLPTFTVYYNEHVLYVFSALFLQWPDNMLMYLFYSLSFCPQRRATGRNSSQDAVLQPCQLWAKELLSEGVYLWGGEPDTVSWHQAAAQRDDGQISYQDGSVAGVRGWARKSTVVDLLDNNIVLWHHVWFCMITWKDTLLLPKAANSRYYGLVSCLYMMRAGRRIHTVLTLCWTLLLI